MNEPLFTEIELALTAAALNGDTGGLYRLATSLMDDGVPFDSLLFDYLIPAEREVGRRWQQGDYLVAEEHAATATVETLISLLSGMLDQPTGGTHVVVATAEGDEHSLPARAVAAHLLFLGYRTTFLGANLPGADLRHYLEPDSPTALVLSCAMTTHLKGAHSVISAAHSVGVPVVVGGKGFGPDGVWADAVGADAWVASPRDVVDVIERWDRAEETHLHDSVDIPADLARLIADRSEVLARAEATLAQADDELPRPAYREGVWVLVGAIEASMLVGDESVVVDMIHWLGSVSNTLGVDVNALTSALLSALESSSTRGRDILSSALQKTDSE